MIFQNKRIAVVILNFNGRYFLEKFLPTVLKYSSGAQIYVADNASTDDSINYVKSSFPDVAIIKNDSNYGFAGGYNKALKQIQADYFVLLNSDVEVTENWINPVVEFMETNENVSACQPKILDFYKRNFFEYAGASGGFIDKYGYPFCRGRIFQELEKDEGQYNNPVSIFWASGACLFIKSNIYRQLGGFDEDLFAHMEEIDLCWRIRNSGRNVYVIPSSVVYHVGGGTLNKSNPRKTFLNFRNSLIVLTKNLSGRLILIKILIRLILDGVAGIKFLLQFQPGNFLAIIKAHWGYFFRLPVTLRKRRAIYRKMDGNDGLMLNRSIVMLHFVKGLKKYSEI